MRWRDLGASGKSDELYPAKLCVNDMYTRHDVCLLMTRLGTGIGRNQLKISQNQLKITYGILLSHVSIPVDWIVTISSVLIP